MSFGVPAAAAYDRAITIFAPDGRIYQVEYAFESVRRGWTTLGMKSDHGAILVVHKRKTQPLIDEKFVQKIFIVDEHVGATFAGMAGDGRVLIEYARTIALLHRFYYDEPVTLEYLARRVGNVKQAYTQHAGVRPFGVMLIFAGMDDEPRVFATEPTGRYVSYYAVTAGEKSSEALSIIEKHYDRNMSVEDMVKLGVEVIARTAEEKVTEENIEAGVITVSERRFRILETEELGRIIREVYSKGKTGD